ncbi:hypothetical protein [Aureibacter tunicatorum]|uniref:Uncharacterized protein n=1 Tax=Aureibacter tunicatorum TaxID=866807 RepID=A0AAE4BVL7_9BACT|nr:hypothetical protein [Aureibacter tunicatorum]MDR6242022.1 hypothetical protein [Aureibacter tunicatorum]BDD07133.1 hypothetical protein AUTU_46160 [Aureibacter tunicatorum]
MSLLSIPMLNIGLKSNATITESLRHQLTNLYGLFLATIIGVTFTLLSLVYFKGLYHIPLAGTLTFGSSVLFFKYGAKRFIKFYMSVMPVFYSNWFASYFCDASLTPFVAVNILNLAFYPWTLVIFDIRTERKSIIYSYAIQILITTSFLFYSPYFTSNNFIDMGLLRSGTLASLTLIASIFFVIAGTVSNYLIYSEHNLKK